MRLCALLFSISLAAAARDPLPPAPARLASVARLAPFVSGLRRPVGLVPVPGDARRFLALEQAGRIRVIRDGKLLSTPFADLSALITSRGNEQGLLGLAFHPGFAKNRRLFVHLTDPRGDIRILELRAAGADAERMDATFAPALVLHVQHPHSNHNGGQLAFSPDGKLVAGLGDGGAGYDPHKNGQNPRALLAKMLRIDVDAAPPVAQVWLIGLRNPWRFSFDRKTGELYIADVGQDRWEEVDVVPAGATVGNYGWSIMEGAHCLRGGSCDRTGLIAPLVEYGHDEGCSITGGYVYRGTDLPELAGNYFYADYCTAGLWSFRTSDGRAVDQWSWKEALDPDAKLAQISSFAEDLQGELYVISLEGSIWKLVRK